MPPPLSHAPMSLQGDACVAPTKNHPPHAPDESPFRRGEAMPHPALTLANVTAGRRMAPTKTNPPHAPAVPPFRRGEASPPLSHMRPCHCRATHASPLRRIIRRMPLMSLPSVG